MGRRQAGLWFKKCKYICVLEIPVFGAVHVLCYFVLLYLCLLLEVIVKAPEARLGLQWFQVILDKPLDPWNYEFVRDEVVFQSEYLW